MAVQIRVLVVDDSAFMRRVISDILESSGDIKVAATAVNGVEALEKVRQFNPDVITLDVEMPEMNGLQCLVELQKITDAPVIMLSSLTRSGAKSTIDALEAGAIDFITKPSGLFDIAGEAKKQEIIEKIRVAKNARTNRTVEGSRPNRNPAVLSGKKTKRNIALKSLVAIGTSTGGPKALQEVLPYIPGDVPAAFLIVQHMPPGFTRSLAERLNSLSELAVKEAEDGEKVMPGVAYIAPGDYHMTLDGNRESPRIKLDQNPLVGGHRPAVNVLMNSLAKSGYKNIIGVIMTGMGADGCEGLINIKKSSDGLIISQDEKSCVVYGMPRAAVLSGVVDIIAPLKEIADEIVKNLGV